LICLIFVDIYYFTLDLRFSWTWLVLLFLLLKLIFWNVNQIWYISGWLGVFDGFSSTKSKICLFYSYPIYCTFLYISFLLVLGYFLLLNVAIISNVLYSGLVNVSKLEKQFLYLPQGLKLNILYLTIQKLFRNFLLFVLLFRRVRLIIDSSSAG